MWFFLWLFGVFQDILITLSVLSRVFSVHPKGFVSFQNCTVAFQSFLLSIQKCYCPFQNVQYCLTRVFNRPCPGLCPYPFVPWPSLRHKVADFDALINNSFTFALSSVGNGDGRQADAFSKLESRFDRFVLIPPTIDQPSTNDQIEQWVSVVGTPDSLSSK